MHRIYDVRIVIEARDSDDLPDTDDVCDAIAELLMDGGEPYTLLRKGTDPRFVGANQTDKRGKWKATTTMRPVRRHTAQGGGR